MGAVCISDGHDYQATLFAYTAAWIKSLGFLFPELSWGEDTYTNELGVALRKAGYEQHYADLKDIVFEHLNPHFGTRAEDDTDKWRTDKREDWQRQYHKRLIDLPRDVQNFVAAIKS